jgi:hypothetical protein
MCKEIAFLCYALDPLPGNKWETPIAHMVYHDPSVECCSDSCLNAGGGYSIKLGFLWYMEWLDDILD